MTESSEEKSALERAKERRIARQTTEPSHLDPVPDEIYNPSEEEKDQAQGHNLRLLYHPASQYTPAEKIYACTLYMYKGNMKWVSQRTGIPEGTLAKWKNHSCWWDETIEKCKALVEDEIEANYRQILQEGTGAMLKKIQEGELIQVGTKEYTDIDEETGQEVKVKRGIYEQREICSKDLNRVIGTMQEKILLLQGKPTSISQRADGASEVLDKLGSKLEQLAKATLESKQLNVVETQDGRTKTHSTTGS